MEYEDKYASKGVAGTGLGLGIAGTALGVLGGGLNGLLGGRAMGCSEDHYINRYEAMQSAKIAELETEVKLRDANTFTMGEMNKLRNYVDSKFESINSSICQQGVWNAAALSNIQCMKAQIAVLSGLTKTVIPKDSICPSVMPEFNSWEAPTAPATGA